MNVIIIPNFSSSNPYQRELAKGLRKHGVYVTMEDIIGRFPATRAVNSLDHTNILHIHWTHTFIFGRNRLRTCLKVFLFIVELIVLKLRGIKIVWTVHNLLDHERRNPRLELLFNKVFVRLCNRIIVHCSAACETVIETYRLPNRYRKKISVIPHGHYVASYPNEVPGERAREELNLDKDSFIFLCFGQIRAYKAILNLVDTFRKLNNSRVYLLIVGKPSDAELVETIKNYIKADKRIEIVPRFIGGREVQLYMNASDVVVLPYEDILASGVAILAMSFGKPIVAPRIGCLKEQLDERGAFLYDPNLEYGLLSAMKEALSADLVSMGESNIRRISSFGWCEIAGKLVNEYKQILGNSDYES